MTGTGFHLFETAIGRCAIAWGPAGIIGSMFPGRDDASTRVRMQRQFRDAREETPPRDVQVVVAEIKRLLAGEQRDLSSAALDNSALAELDRRV
jgi:methylated-DNA-[protein]-cysteine S-methyltransferase